MSRHPSAPDGTRPLISVREAAFRYPGGSRAVDGVSFEVDAGEVVGIAGTNGAGKTTLARLLPGFLRPTTGSVLIDGRDTREQRVDELARVVGMVFQDPRTQLFARTVADELAFGPNNLGVPAAAVAGRVAAVAERLGLGDVLGASPFSLPRPRRRLVALASILVMEPRVLVLDEPTAGQDHVVAEQVATLVRSLARDGVAVVCTSHDMPLLAGTASRVLVLSAGRVGLDGPPRSVLGDAAGLAAAGLAAPQVTRLAAAVPRLGLRGPVLTVEELVTTLTAGTAPGPGR